VARLNREIVKAVNLPVLHARFTEQGAEPVGNTPEQFAAFIRSEMTRYAKIVRDARVTVE
jgi:tripartite-type tricarboxylate transporter receptor subunit TctC